MVNEIYVAKLIKDLENLKGMFAEVFDKLEAEDRALTTKESEQKKAA